MLVRVTVRSGDKGESLRCIHLLHGGDVTCNERLESKADSLYSWKDIGGHRQLLGSCFACNPHLDKNEEEDVEVSRERST